MLSSTTTIEPDRAWSACAEGSTAISTAMRSRNSAQTQAGRYPATPKVNQEDRPQTEITVSQFSCTFT